MNIAELKNLLLLKGKFAISSVFATIVDYVIYTLLADVYMGRVAANLISRPCGMLTNFILHKKFVFELNRKLSTAFALSLAVSLGGLLIGTVIIYFIGDLAIWNGNKYYPKIIETGSVFFYNFYLKRFAFENRFIGSNKEKAE